MTNRRYPFDDLAAMMRESEHQACVLLGVSGSTEKEYRERGLTEKVGERLATKVGFHPYAVWPQMRDDAIADAEQVEAERKVKRRAYTRAYYVKNRKELLVKQRERDRADAEVKRRAARYNYWRDPDHHREYARRHYWAHRDAELARRRKRKKAA